MILQLQQQMLSQLTSGTSQTTSAAGVKNNRKRPASSMSSADTREGIFSSCTLYYWLLCSDSLMLGTCTIHCFFFYHCQMCSGLVTNEPIIMPA